MARHTTCTTVRRVWEGVGGVSIAAGIVGAIGILVADIMLDVAASVGGVAAITPQTMAFAAVMLMSACLLAIKLINQLRDYFFDFRLVCLGGNGCAIAWVKTIEADSDGDRALNTVLAPAKQGTAEADYRSMLQASSLVYVDPGLASRGWGLEPKANRKDANPAAFGSGDLPFFHCEIEGTYLDDWTMALLAVLWTLFAAAAAALALAVAALALGPIAWAIFILVALLILLLALFGIHMGRGDPDIGQASDAPIEDMTPGPNGVIVTDSPGNTIYVGDHIALLGRHVCDTGHHTAGGGCWDELHPILGITRLGASDYDDAPATHTAGDVYDKYCAAPVQFVDPALAVRLGLTRLEHPAIG